MKALEGNFFIATSERLDFLRYKNPVSWDGHRSQKIKLHIVKMQDGYCI